MIPPARSRAPLTSTGSGRVARDSIIFVATRTKAITPSGRLIEKIERQPKVTVRNAPRMGPARLATPQTAAEQALDARALAQREEVAGHDEGDGHEAARAESLQHAGGDELGHGLRRPRRWRLRPRRARWR